MDIKKTVVFPLLHSVEVVEKSEKVFIQGVLMDTRLIVGLSYENAKVLHEMLGEVLNKTQKTEKI